MHHGRRLAVTAGATVLGLAAMSGVGHADTGASTRTGSPLADLTGALTGTLEGITGALTGGSASSGTKGSTRTAKPASSTSPATTTASRTAGRPATTKAASGGTTKAAEKSKGAATTRKATAKKAAKASTRSAAKPAAKADTPQEEQPPLYLRLEIAPTIDLEKATVSGKLGVATGLNTLLGPVGLTLEADGRLSAEDIKIGDPEAEGGLKLGTRLGDAALGVATRGGLKATPTEVGANGSLDLCVGASNCERDGTPPPTDPGKPEDPGQPGEPEEPGQPGDPGNPPGGGQPPSGGDPTPGLPQLPPSSPLLPDLPRANIAADVSTDAAPPPPKDLPFTGTDGIPLALLGLTALTAGGVAVASTRRRKAQES